MLSDLRLWLVVKGRQRRGAGRLDVARPPGKRVATGVGHHFRLAAPQAQLVMRIAIGATLAQLPNPRLAREMVRSSDSFNVRGVAELRAEGRQTV